MVFAVGFGVEESELPGFRSYWENDDFDNTDWFDEDKDKPRTWLVSGDGDGALTDLLRLRIEGFRHENMVRDFVSDPRIGDVIQEIRRIESDPRARDATTPEYLQEEYEKLEVPFVVELIRGRPRRDTKVTLNSARGYYFQPGSSVLNRFLVAQLRHAGGFEYVPGAVLPSTSKVPGARRTRPTLPALPTCA